MKTNYTEFFVEIKADLGMELFKQVPEMKEVIIDGEITFEEGLVDLVTDRITAPLGTDLSDWQEREK